MKTKTKYFKASISGILSFLFLFPLLLSAQTFDGNIPIPSTDGGGAMIGDIINTPNHIFVYSLDKITAYNKDGTYAGEVIFDMTEDYGKVNPIYFWEKMYVSSTSLMAYNEKYSTPYLFAVSPDLWIYVISLDANNFLSYVKHEPVPLNPSPPQQVVPLDVFIPMHGNCILKYDEINDRLFWVIDAQDQTSNNVGSHHVRQRYFFIFNVTYSSSVTMSTLYSDHQYASAANYEYGSILDFEINKNSNSSEVDFFYLSKISQLEVWKIEKDPSNAVSMVGSPYYIQNNYNCPYYKSCLEYIYDPINAVHKIVAYPYRFPSCGNFDNPDIFVLDGDHNDSNISWQSTLSPSKKITDVGYLPEMQHLILSYAADPINIVPSYDPTHDICVFQFSGNNLVFIEGLSTDASPKLATIHDFNTPIDIVPVSNSSALICKEDEISLLGYSHNSYQSESKLIRENSFFLKGISFDNDNKFILNAGMNGFQVLDGSSSPTIKHENGYQANHICMDNDGNKFYLFNKLNTYNTGLYILDIDPNGSITYNINSPFDSPITAPIGDCIYNPYLDHFLVSENTYNENGACVKVLVNNDWNSLFETIILEESPGGDKSHYARDMFIAPNGILYVMADMNYDTEPGKYPKVFFFSATDGEYTPIGYAELSNMPALGVSCDFYIAHFCYNHYNGKVYASITPQRSLMSPYEASSNCLYNAPTNSGLLVEFEENQLSGSVILSSAGKIICPDNRNPEITSQYGENMFIIGTYFNKISPPYMEPGNIQSIAGFSFDDITYSPKHDMLFALADEKKPDENNEYRVINVYSIEYIDGSLQKIPLIVEDGQATCIFNNLYDGRVYVHQKMDEEKLAETPVRLLSFYYDPNITPPIQPTITNLDIYSLYPEFDHNPDEIKNLKLYNITTPVINPYNNTIYIPNGGHSCVSKVSFDANESVLLNGKDNQNWVWLSFPRMNRSNNNPISVNSVLGGNRLDPNDYLEGSQLKYLSYQVGQQNNYIFNYNNWNGVIWSGEQGQLYNVKSTLGYKLNLDYDEPEPEQVWLNMTGTVLIPGPSIDLPTIYTRPNPNAEYFDNWIGYYLYQEQSPFDAISEDDLEHIYLIKGQYWTCAKFWGDGIPHPYWVCQCSYGKSVSLKYGDMVILKTYQEINNFQWQVYGMQISDGTYRPETENYTFTEQADYTPIFIELDSTVNPTEIGAFVEDSCVGATSVFPEDTTVLVPAYTEGISGEIYFESYYGSNKSYVPPITKYYVKSNQGKKSEKRMIHTSEKEDYYLVSFKDIEDKAHDKQTRAIWIKCHPNPVRANSTITCYVLKDGFAEIKLYNIMGTEQMVLHSGMLSTGTHDFSFSAKDTAGKQLSNGTYILSIKSDKYQSQIKIIIL
ncbi:MAG: T9SS type A sorting domain-containing protein [Bacteroidales bacterium]|nr:T9SS type A sorting domain-containing protein [Bacteroidales bacterium]